MPDVYAEECGALTMTPSYDTFVTIEEDLIIFEPLEEDIGTKTFTLA